MSSYTVTTWVYANMLCPLIFYVYAGGDLIDIMTAIFYYFPIVIFSFVFSLPSLLLSLMALEVIAKFRISVRLKLLTWLVLAPVIVLVNYFSISYIIFHKEIMQGDFWIILNPVMMAVTTIILLRLKLFYVALYKLQKKQQVVEEQLYEK